MTQRCLITGAAGFVGSAFVRELMQHPRYEPILVQRATVHEAPYLHSRVVLVNTIDAKTDWSAALDTTDAVVHLAARAHVLRETSGDEKQVLTMFRMVNTAGTLNLAQQAAQAGVHRFVFISSIGVLGASSNMPFSEHDAPAPLSPYAMSKQEAENGLRQIAQDTGMEVVIIRPPLVYGPHAPGNFARLAGLIQRGLPLPLGRVTNKRSLIGLGNLVDFIRVCLEHPAAANQTFLVCDGEDLSTPDLIRRMALAMHRPARLVPVPLPLLNWAATMLGQQQALQQLTGDLQINCSKANTLLGWQPPFSVEDGLRHSFTAADPTAS